MAPPYDFAKLFLKNEFSTIKFLAKFFVIIKSIAPPFSEYPPVKFELIMVKLTFSVSMNGPLSNG